MADHNGKTPWTHRQKTPERIAYEAGWKASSTSKTFDLDAAERRFENKHGRDYGGSMFAAGWTDYASDYPKYEALERNHPDA